MRAQNAKCRVRLQEIPLLSPSEAQSPKPGVRRCAFTLIEVLIVMGLLVVIFSAIWGIVEMFSRSFVRGETRAERSQLVRSLSLLVTDDLACAIQDPLHPAREANASAVRRFGLSGTNTSIRIDVLQINPFRPGSTTVQYGVQAPELKTVYYDFSLLSPDGGGLTRRELDFETPTGLPNQQNGIGANMGDGYDDTESRTVIGSETRSLADYGGASLTDRVATANTSRSRQQPMPMMSPEMQAANAAARYAANEKLQLEMSATEVVGCWFRYYDGSQWRDNWNSLNQRGLPVAIEITLKMMPLAEARTLRESRLALQVVNGPGVSTVIAANETAYANQYAANMSAMRQNASAAGSRSSSPADYGGGSLSDRATQTTLTDRMVQQNMMPNQPMGTTVEQLAEQLDLLPPTEQRIVIRVPTTPLISQKELQREQPTASDNPTDSTRRQRAPRQQAQRSVERRSTASDNQQRRQRTGNRQQSPDWIRQ